MSKIKKKMYNWYSKEQYDYVLKNSNSFFSEIQLYKLKDDIKFHKSIKADKLHTNKTLELFSSFSQNYKLDFVHKIKNSLHSIAKYDIVFGLNENYYLYHTYKILGFIRESVFAYSLSKDKFFLKGTIAEYGSRESEFYSSQFSKYIKRLSENINIYKGVDLIYASLYRNLHFRKDFTKYYLSYYAIFGIENMQLLNNDKLESKIIKNALKVFQSGQVNKKDCAKSLLSVLHYYLVYKMKINKNHALSIVKDLVHSVFNIYTEYRSSEILKNIYVKEVIGSHVIYSFDPKTPHIRDNDKMFLKKIFNDNPLVKHKSFPTQIIQPILDNPLQLYSLITPSELLQKI